MDRDGIIRTLEGVTAGNIQIPDRRNAEVCVQGLAGYIMGNVAYLW